MNHQEAPVSTRVRQRLTARYAVVDGHALRDGVAAACEWLRTNHETVNNLNVFPVPDGDTGTNMLLTMQSAWDEISSRDETSLGTVAKGVAQGALMGARGNSGVILSQLWRGFSRSIDGKDEVDVQGLVRALAEARDTAYKGVVRPVEGTILTVSKDIARAAQEAVEAGVDSTLGLLEQIVEAADQSVQRTPDLLPVLKEAGVVDSGGMGLFIVLEGMLRSAYGLPLDKPEKSVKPLHELDLESAQEEIEEGQDWEVVIDFRPKGALDTEDFYRTLKGMGTSIQVGEGEGMYRMHIHVPDTTQYAPIDYVSSLGTVTKVMIENLMDMIETRAQAGGVEIHVENARRGEVAVVAVSPGPGIGRVFGSLGAAAVVEGGQTMNPSTEEILTAIENLPSSDIIILPNNPNIVLCATQAAEMTVKHARVVPTRTVPQGVAAMLRLEGQAGLEANQEAMTSAMKDVVSGELTVATRDATVDGIEVAQGQVIGLIDGRLAVSGDSLETTLINLLEAAGADASELLTLYSGRDLPLQTANQHADAVRRRWPQLDVELVEGGQPHYDFILSLE